MEETEKKNQDFVNLLFAQQDSEYKAFNIKLIPNVDPDSFIGVRTPAVRALAKKLMKEDRDGCFRFMDLLPHRYYEQNNLHAFMIGEIKEYNEAMEKTRYFLPYVDNWATCDLFSPKIFKKYPDEVYAQIKIWLKSDLPYTVRYGIGLLLENYLDEEFKEEMPKLVSEIESDEYYVNMMIAWYFSTALVKQFDTAFPYIEKRKLKKQTHNKTIQKALESRRVTEERKQLLKSLKIK